MSDATTDRASEIKTQDLAALVGGMSRFLTRLSNIPPFQEAGLGLAEWSALSIIASKNGINNRKLANTLGVSAQRVNQITVSLKRAKHISLDSSADDGRKKIIAITPSGTALLNGLNAKLDPMIAAALKQPKTLGRASRLINKTLMRIVGAPKRAVSPEHKAARAAKLAAHKAAKAAKSAERQAATSA